MAQGKAIADASVSAGATQIIWSSLPNITLLSHGQLTTVTHFDSKAAVEIYIRSLPILATFFMAGWYMQNQLTIMRPVSVGCIDD